MEFSWSYISDELRNFNPIEWSMNLSPTNSIYQHLLDANEYMGIDLKDKFFNVPVILFEFQNWMEKQSNKLRIEKNNCGFFFILDKILSSSFLMFIT